MSLFDLFNLSATVKLNSKDYEIGIEKVKAKTIMVGNLMADLVKKAASFGPSLVKLGLTYNMQMEDYTTNFKVMLGSMEAAEAKVEELKTMAAKTPFAMSDLADATQTLLAFGVESEKTTSVMSKLGDISLGNAQRMSSLSNAYGKAAAQGKLTGEVVQMMVDAGFNPLLQISDATGESMENLQKRMSEGRVSIDELDLALRRATSEGGQFYRGMEEASKTLSGQLSTLEDNWSALLGEAMSPVNEQLSSKTLPAAIEALDKLSEALFGVGEDAETAKKKLFIDAEGNEQDPSQNLLTWVSDLMAEWTNGVTEDDATVTAYVEKFNYNTDMIKDALWKRINDTSNPMTDEELEAAKAKITDIEGMQAEVEALLQKRQGGYITEEEEARLNTILTTLQTMQTELEATASFETNIVSPWERMISAAGDASTDFITKLGDFFIWCAEDGENMNTVLNGAKVALAAIAGLKFGGLLGALAGAGVVTVINNLEKIRKKAVQAYNALAKLLGVWGYKERTTETFGTILDNWDTFKSGPSGKGEGISGSVIYADGTVKEVNPGSGSVGFATGLDYVPYNEFPALLHEGEAVLTKLEAQQWRSGVQNGGADVSGLISAVRELVLAVKESPTVLSVDGRTFAYATVGNNSRAMNARRNDINIGKVRF